MKSLFSQIFHVYMLFHEAEVARTAFFLKSYCKNLTANFSVKFLLRSILNIHIFKVARVCVNTVFSYGFHTHFLCLLV